MVKTAPNFTAFALSLSAGVAFIGAFSTPFTRSDFEVKLPDNVETALKSATDPCSFLGNLKIPGSEFVRQKCQQGSLGIFETALGPVHENPKQSWNECITLYQAQQNPEPWRACVKEWIITEAKIPVGEQRILPVIGELFTIGEIPLGTMLLLFSVLFPLTKVFLSLWLAVFQDDSPGSHRTMQFLKLTSKWSMTDVFVVALIIVFFKAENFNFHFEAEIGTYLFAAGAILSSAAVYSLESGEEKKKKLSSSVSF
jgi:hypothetical protein